MATPSPVSPPITVAVIVPVLNEAAHLEDFLSELIEIQHFDEIIVVDGGSTDTSMELVCKLLSSDVEPIPQLIQSERGRAIQMHAGAQAATSDVLLFLHADSTLPPGAAGDIRDAIDRGRLWGHFDVRLSGRSFMFRVIERLMNGRARLTGIATGDQGLFVRSDVYWVLGGFAALPLMEDIDFSTRLKSVGKPLCLRGPLVTSSRRWERSGMVRTILQMWVLRLLYGLGVSPARLARWYNFQP